MDYYKNGHRLIRVVLTGGPCSGKTTAIQRIRKEPWADHYYLLTMPETATELIGSGITPWTCRTPVTYQRLQMIMQMKKEQIYAQAAEEISEKEDKDIIIFYDRGMMDNKAYIPLEDFYRILEELEVTEEECLSWYDAVFHLETVAKGNAQFYQNDNNECRIETVEEAVAVDNCSLAAWEAHPNRSIIDNSMDFDAKMDLLMEKIHTFLNEMETEVEECL